MTQLLAFHNDPAIKAKYVARIEAHKLADEIQHGYYWDRGKGCAVGCTVHSSHHGAFETELGIPRILAKLEDRIFEGLDNGYAKEFPVRFLTAIQPGANLSMVWPAFAVWLLVDPEHGVDRFTKKDSRQWISIHAVADLYRRTLSGEDVPKAEFKSAADAAADAAAAAAADAAYAAAYAAADAAAADAADAADAAAYAAAADAAARKKSFKAQADKLIELLAAA